jgi:type II secretory pathway component PulC
MINKIKDFLKNKLGKRPPRDLPEEDSSVVDLGTQTQVTNPFTRFTSRTKSFSFKNIFGVRTMKLPSMKKDDGGGGAPLLSPSLSKFVEKFFSRSSREPIHQFFLIVLICGFTWTLGKMAALALKGQPSISSPKEYALDINLSQDFDPITLGQIRSINPFRTNTTGGGKKKVADTKCEQATQASNLPIKLVNTVVLQDEVKSLASVQVRNDRDLVEVRQGDKIQNLAEIFKITRLGMLVKNLESGVCESITSDKGLARGASPIEIMSPSAAKSFKAQKKMAGIENVGNKFQIKKALLDEKMKDLQSILTQARGIPYNNPDGTMSFKVTEIDPNGIFPYLGIQDGDIITSINGKPIYSLNEVMNLFGRIRNLDQLSLGIKREGSDTTQEYNIQK